MNLTEIFGWDIDFSLNVQAGDSFKIIYDDVYVDGEKKLSGNILAAEFVNNGKTFRAIAHPDDSGDLKYYAPDGTSMQKTFLRSPVKFSRISSRFTKARFHPVLKKWRAHKGVDYAAGRGTPIRATANGKISHLGRKGGYGKTIIINNGSTYSTLYAHLSSYSRGLKKGSHVKQGQVIGKVGSTGLASGPHLHYEFRINGKHVNPLTFRQPAAEPISDSQRVSFLKTSERMNLELDSIQILQVATESTLDNS
jgi:murein DD-endopeptidase MepM/ murein hydrolase activator NlpD